MAIVRMRIEANREVTPVIATENRKQVDRGERVIWEFEGATDGLDLRVEFNRGPEPGALNPFDSILASLGTNQIGGTISQGAPGGLYIYAIFDGPDQLVWTIQLPEGNFGGLEVPRT